MGKTQSWSTKYFPLVVVQKATQTARAVERYQCLICALKKLQDHLAAHPRRRGHDDDETAPFDFNAWLGDGCYSQQAPDKFRNHMESVHHVVDP